ncbi:hypothetical protein OROGR_015210 [Orobanche gracilis]
MYRVNEVTWNECERAQVRATWMNSLENDRICREQLRLDKRRFKKLCHLLQSKGWLVTTRNVTVKEVVAHFLHVLGHDLKNRTMQALFARSGETVSRQFHVALESVLKLGGCYIKKVDHTTNYANDPKWKWFEHVVGALDGTHIKMTVPIEDRLRYRDKKGDISTNVLATCDPNLRFTYVLPGWEGSTSDPRVLRDALRRRSGLRVPRRVMQRQGKEHVAPPPAPTTNRRGYVTWNSKIDVILTSTLFEQINEGNKGDGDFKPQAYQDVVDKLRVQLNITASHVKNRIKSWKKHFAIITEIRTYTKFRWDEERKMLVIPIEELEEWKTYCKENSSASAYQNKCIDNWVDICTLFASDRATGDGSEQHEESATAMEMENEVGSGSETVSMESNKRIMRDRLAHAVTRFSESFNEYVSKAQGPSRPSSKEIYDIISVVPRISRMKILKGVKSFTNGTVDMFNMLKSLPDGDKLDWVLLHIND